MAYNYYQPYYQAQPQMNQPMQTQPQVQTSGFISVRNEMEARNYPVAYGNSVTFKDENAPYVYTKTMGFSQLETPRFEKYKLVKEEANLPQVEPQKNEPIDLSSYVQKSEIEAIWTEIDSIKKSLSPKKKKEVAEDE